MDMKFTFLLRKHHYADIYDYARPQIPDEAISRICSYLSWQPRCVVDLGCGTGLSCEKWCSYSEEVIGVDIRPDLLSVATKKKHPGLRFLCADASSACLPERCADIVICSQAFHWMNTIETLNQVNRILRPGGVFAILDYEIMPMGNYAIEKCFFDFVQDVDEYISNHSLNAQPYPKMAEHSYIQILDQSGNYSFIRKIHFSSSQEYDSKRLTALAASQGKVFNALRSHEEGLSKRLDTFYAEMDALCASNTVNLDFAYTVYLGVKNA